MSTFNKKKSSNHNITAKLQAFLWKDIQRYIKTNNLQALSTLYSRYSQDTAYVLLNCLASYRPEDITIHEQENHPLVAAVDPRLTDIFHGLKKVNALELAILYNREQIATRLIDWTTAATTIDKLQHKQPKQHYYDTGSNSITNQVDNNNNNNNNVLITPLCYKAISILGWKKAHLFNMSLSTSPTVNIQPQQPPATVNMHTSIFMKKATEKVARLYCAEGTLHRSNSPQNYHGNDIQKGSGISPSPSPVSLTYSSSSSCSTSSSSSLSSLTSEARWSPTTTSGAMTLLPVKVFITNKQAKKSNDRNSNGIFVKRDAQVETYYNQPHRIQNEKRRKEDYKNATPMTTTRPALLLPSRISYVDENDENMPTSNLRDHQAILASNHKKKNKSVQFSTRVILLDACSRGDLDELKYYAASSNSHEWNSIRDLQKRSLLHIAIMHKHEHLIPFLIERHVEIGLLDVDGWTCAHYAAALNLWKSLSLILSFPESYDLLIANKTTTDTRQQQQQVKIEDCPETVVGRRKCKILIQKAFIKLQHSKELNESNFTTTTTTAMTPAAV